MCVCVHVLIQEKGTHAGVLLEFVQEVLGRNEVVQEVAETVMLIGGLKDRKDLKEEAERKSEDGTSRDKRRRSPNPAPQLLFRVYPIDFFFKRRGLNLHKSGRISSAQTACNQREITFFFLRVVLQASFFHGNADTRAGATL